MLAPLTKECCWKIPPSRHPLQPSCHLSTSTAQAGEQVVTLRNGWAAQRFHPPLCSQCPPAHSAVSQSAVEVVGLKMGICLEIKVAEGAVLDDDLPIDDGQVCKADGGRAEQQSSHWVMGSACTQQQWCETGRIYSRNLQLRITAHQLQCKVSPKGIAEMHNHYSHRCLQCREAHQRSQ